MSDTLVAVIDSMSGLARARGNGSTVVIASSATDAAIKAATTLVVVP